MRWCGAVWSGVLWCGAVWSGVRWCGAVRSHIECAMMGWAATHLARVMQYLERGLNLADPRAGEVRIARVDVVKALVQLGVGGARQAADLIQ